MQRLSNESFKKSFQKEKKQQCEKELKKENDVADAAVPGSMFPEGIMNAIQMYMW